MFCLKTVTTLNSELYYIDDSRVSKAFSGVCDSVYNSVCLSVHMIKPKRLKVHSPKLAQG